MAFPMQPVHKDKDGVHRFQANEIVRYLLDWASDRGCSLNDLARMKFSDADRCQFAQLIGYSVSGYSELHYVSDEEYQRAHAAPVEG